MSSFDWIFGHRQRWTFDPARRVHQENIETKRAIDPDSFFTEQAERAFNRENRPKKYKTSELMALLPTDCGEHRCIDSVIHETVQVLHILEND